MEPLIRIGLRAARQFREQLLSTYERPPFSRMQRQALHNYTARLKNRLHRNFEKAILSVYPDHSVVPDISDVSKTAPVTWVIQPLDGTANYLRSLNDFCAVLGIFEGSWLRHAIVYDYLLDDEYYASQDEGAIVNQNRLRVANNTIHDEALVAVSEQFSSPSKGSAYYHKVHALLSATMQGVRTSGSTAMDLARVARGKLDAFVTVEPSSDIVQIAKLLVTEAGGFAAQVEPSVGNSNLQLLIAANPQLSSTIGALLGQRLIESDRSADSQGDELAETVPNTDTK